MFRRIVLLVLLCVAPPAAAQRPAPPPAPATIRVLLHTSAGDILVALETQRAPLTAGNFLHYVDTHRLDGSEFYRPMHTAPDAGLIQGGVRNGRLLFPPVAPD